MIFALFFAIFLLFPGSCVKPPDYPDTPVITYKSMSKTQMKQGTQGEDSLTVVFSYTDGDGDLGFPDNDSQASIFIQDARDSFPKFSYKIPYIEPQGTGNGISGDISIVLPTSCCIYTTPAGIKLSCNKVPQSFKTDTLLYKIRIMDRAGHMSNTISTEKITLVCWN
ncbi:MAG: hypothetical protein KGS48_16525 [Bacteroidetes bacterium]|nr:hypothetical protein [Bacteroidota bacterium]